MMRLTGSTLFIVGSPFQCLCMLEAIVHFSIRQYDVIVPEGTNKQTLNQVSNLLNGRNILYEVCRINHAIKDLIPLVLRRHKHYNNIFLGNYYAPILESVAAFYGTLRYNVFFLDDGTQALSLFSNQPRKRYSSKEEAAILKLYMCLGYMKFRKKENFFTIYNVKSTKFNIIKNDFNLLRTLGNSHHQGCYIIGTNSSILKFKDFTYQELLSKLILWISKKYPNENVYYCPHRRDSNNNVIKEFCEQHNVLWFETEISVEFDFTEMKLNPQLVVGFTSNALYTLKMIFPKTDVKTVYYHIEPDRADEETAIIREGMKKNRIETLILQ